MPSKKILEKIHSLKDKKWLIATIEPETGEYFLGKTLTEAQKKQKKNFLTRFSSPSELDILLSMNIKEI
jgi:hypothetical protein